MRRALLAGTALVVTLAAGTLDYETRHAVVVDFTTQVYDASTNCSLC